MSETTETCAKCADLQRRLDAVTALADEWESLQPKPYPFKQDGVWGTTTPMPTWGQRVLADCAAALRRALAGTDTDGGGE